MTVNKFCPVAQGEYYNIKSQAKSQLFFPFFQSFFFCVCNIYILLLSILINTKYCFEMRFSSQPEPFSGSGRFPDHLLIVHHPYKFIPNSTTPTTTKHPYITLSASVLLSLIQKSSQTTQKISARNIIPFPLTMVARMNMAFTNARPRSDLMNFRIFSAIYTSPSGKTCSASCTVMNTGSSLQLPFLRF